MATQTGIITIGQSPRPDLIADFVQISGRTEGFIVEGALDGLSDAAIAALAPAVGESDLITCLADGRSVYVSHDRLTSYVQAAINRACQKGVQAVVIACTGAFHGLEAALPIIEPCRVLEHSVASVLEKGSRLTLIVPTAGQGPEARARWEERGFFVAAVQVASPFEERHLLIERLASDETVMASDGIVYDCFGFGTDYISDLAPYYKKPVFAARVLAANLLSGIFAV